MSNFILATPILSDAATITGSEALGDMTIGNLQKRSLKRKYRTDELSSAEINIDLGSEKEINCIALIAHNASASGTVTVRAGDTEAVNDYTSGNLALISGADVGHEKNLFLLFLETSQTYRYWQLEIADASNPDGFFEAGRIYLANAFQPSTNMDYGEGQGFIDNSRVTRTISGEPIPTIRNPYGYAAFSLSFGSESEMYGALYDIDRLRGTSRDVLYVKNPEATTHLQRQYIYGLMAGLNPIVNATFGLFQKEYRIEEIPA